MSFINRLAWVTVFAIALVMMMAVVVKISDDSAETSCSTEYVETANAYVVTFCDEKQQKVVYRHGPSTVSLVPNDMASTGLVADLESGRRKAYAKWPDLRLADADAEARAMAIPPEPISEPILVR